MGVLLGLQPCGSLTTLVQLRCVLRCVRTCQIADHDGQISHRGSGCSAEVSVQSCQPKVVSPESILASCCVVQSM